MNFLTSASNYLNFFIGKSREVSEFHNCFGTVAKATAVINKSAEKLNRLEHHVKSASGDLINVWLFTLTDTGKVDRHDAVIIFHQLLDTPGDPTIHPYALHRIQDLSSHSTDFPETVNVSSGLQ